MTEIETLAREADTERLERSPCFWTLPPFLRVLLITDGTVTQSLEAYFADPIEAVVLSHHESVCHRQHAAIDVAPGDRVFNRRVVLRGKRTGTLYAAAESVIVVSRLPENVRQGLQEERMGIGEILRDGHLETFRNLLGSRRTNVGAWARELIADPAASAVARTYAIHIGGQPCVEIEETFPESRFVC